MKKPTPPLIRLIREGTTVNCPKCGSSRKYKFWPFKSKHCIQPECENYYGNKIIKNKKKIIALKYFSAYHGDILVKLIKRKGVLLV